MSQSVRDYNTEAKDHLRWFAATMLVALAFDHIILGGLFWGLAVTVVETTWTVATLPYLRWVTLAVVLTWVAAFVRGYRS